MQGETMKDIFDVLVNKFNLSPETARDIISSNFPKVPTHIPCEIYSRVVGYYRPVDQWNAAQKEQFRERMTFDKNKFKGKGC